MKKFAAILMFAMMAVLFGPTAAHAEISTPTPPPTAPLFNPKAVFKHCVPVMKRNQICWTYDAGKMHRARYYDHIPQSNGKILWIVVWGR